MNRPLFCYGVISFALVATLCAQQTDQETIKQLMQRLEESERRIQALEQKVTALSASPAAPAPARLSTAPESAAAAVPPPEASPAIAQLAAEPQVDAEAHPDTSMGHNMEIPGGGPTLNIRGFFDFNFGTGSIANPLLFPVASNGCDRCGYPVTPPHSGFQSGEFDLFMTSRLSDHLSFLTEVILGADTSNEFSIDIERYELNYRLNDYFSVSAGRFHTAIGYYNTAYHHGNWFSTAEGRPIMYLFEDSGGVLPVHTVGVTMTGLVPHTGSLGLHWIAEMGNGRSSNPGAVEPVQNFYVDRSYKALNLAAFIKPSVLPGLQIGGSYYHDRLNPAGLPHVDQYVASAYAVYFSPAWEFMNEAVLLSNQMTGTRVIYRSPMAYTQVSRNFGIYHPYFRYQYVNDRIGDPVNILQGLYYGPSVGLRLDFSEYAAFKLQYNRLWKGSLPSANGLDAQIAFTF